jgi:hypothetical protein
MTHVRSWLVLAAVALQFSAMPAFAKDPPPDVKADNKEKFDAVVDHVRQEMGAGGRFEFLTAEERATVNRDLDDMHGLFDRFGNVDAMDDKSKIQLYNEQSEVNAVLTKRDGEREVCTHEIPTGSKLPKTTCRNYAQMERERRDMLNEKDAMLHTMLPYSKVGH